MRMPWNKTPEIQLDLLDAAADALRAAAASEPKPAATPLDKIDLLAPLVVEPAPAPAPAPVPAHAPSTPAAPELAPAAAIGEPAMVPIDRIYEDERNPRTEFSEGELIELSGNIAQHGILQPIVVHPADENGRYRIHFGAMRLRAAKLAGLREVPVIVRNQCADAYAQVAENQKRCPLTPLDLARFIRARVDDGDSNATVAKKLGMDQTAVAHHMALLTLPPVLEAAMKSGKCCSPRTLYELAKLHETRPDVVETAVVEHAELTRAVVASIKTRCARKSRRPASASKPTARQHKAVLDQIQALCDRLEVAFRMARGGNQGIDIDRLTALRKRLNTIAGS